MVIKFDCARLEAIPVKSRSPLTAKSGLGHWMLQAPRKAAKAAAELTSRSVHDVRVVLRRCRSLVDGFRAVDPDKRWQKMRRSAKGLFDSLGALRDSYVMQEWVKKLGQESDPVTHVLLAHFKKQESDLKQQARRAIKSFDVKQWNQWSSSLPRRAARLPLNSEVFQTLALEKLTAARRLQSQALKTESDAALHRLRIALKKFRYAVENFLPILHPAWGDDLKRLQDLLGEVHDLDLLRQTLSQVCADVPSQSRGRWEEILQRERTARIAQYRGMMLGENSLWSRWRSALPRGKAARNASLTRLQAWSSFLDSDLKHSRRVARFALGLYNGLEQAGVINSSHKNDRELLRAAATVHEVGRAQGNKNHHKKTEKMVVQLRHLAGWTHRDVTAMAQIARYHRGQLPRREKLRHLPRAERNKVKLLAGVLRLANALDADHRGSIQRFKVARNNGFVIIRAQGLVADSSLAETIAAARHLLEITCGLPVLVQPMPARLFGRTKPGSPRPHQER